MSENTNELVQKVAGVVARNQLLGRRKKPPFGCLRFLLAGAPGRQQFPKSARPLPMSFLRRFDRQD